MKEFGAWRAELQNTAEQLVEVVKVEAGPGIARGSALMDPLEQLLGLTTLKTGANRIVDGGVGCFEAGAEGADALSDGGGRPGLQIELIEDFDARSKLIWLEEGCIRFKMGEQA